jgi:hypothetical protein
MKRPYRDEQKVSLKWFAALAIFLCLGFIPLAWMREFYLGVLIAVALATYLLFRLLTSSETNTASTLNIASHITINPDDSFWKLKRQFKPKRRLWVQVLIASAIAGYFYYESNLSLWISGGAIALGVVIYSLISVNMLTLKEGVLTSFAGGKETEIIDLRTARYYRIIRGSPEVSDKLALYDANDVELIQLDMNHFDLSPILAWATRSLEARSLYS